MSRECITGCWRIQQILKNMGTDNLIGAVGPIHPDMFGGDDTQAKKLLAVCEASYECSGPGTAEEEVIKGFFKKRTETRTLPTCGIPNEHFES